MPDAPTDRHAPDDRRASADGVDHDGVLVPTAGARGWAVAGAVGAVTAVWFVFPGVLGMVAGSIAHLKGDRWGMPIAVMSALTTIAGMALAFWARG